MVKKFIIGIEKPLPIFNNHSFINSYMKLFIFSKGRKVYISKEQSESDIFRKTYNSIEEAESVIDVFLKNKPENYESSLSIMPIYTKN
jgi:hypothetical protein